MTSGNMKCLVSALITFKKKLYLWFAATRGSTDQLEADREESQHLQLQHLENIPSGLRQRVAPGQLLLCRCPHQ